MEENKYSGFYCKLCKSIPLFQIIYAKNQIKIYSSCFCHKQYETIDSFIKNKYIKNISGINAIPKKFVLDINDNNIIKKEENLNFNTILNEFIKSKEKLNETANKIKAELISLYNKKIKEFNIIYEQYIAKNDKIISIIQKLFDSYQLMKDNPSIIENIKNNCIFNSKYNIDNLLNDFNRSIESSFKNIESYFENELIIKYEKILPIYQKNEKKYYSNSQNSINCFFEIDDEICVSCFDKGSNIYLYDFKNEVKERFLFKAHLKNIYSINKTSKNNIISIGDDGLIKVWPLITRNFLLENKRQIDLENNEGFKPFGINKFAKIEFKLNPIYQYNYDYIYSYKFNKILNLKNDHFLTASDTSIDIYEYENINNSFSIKKLKMFHHDSLNVYLIELNEKEVIALCKNNYIQFLYLEDFKNIKEINIKSLPKNSLLQLNSKEILILDNLFYINIYNIDNFELKIKIKNYHDIDFLLNLNDGTIIMSCFKGIKRYLIKTMEELPQLIKFNDNNFYIDYEYYDYDYNFNRKKIILLYKLKNKRIAACYKDDAIEIFNIKF